jgi:hypothetical protein
MARVARSGVSGAVAVGGAYGAGQTVAATITIRREGRRVRTVHTATGRFRVPLRPGHYRLRAVADSGNGTGSARVHVRCHRFTTVVVRLQSPAP